MSNQIQHPVNNSNDNHIPGVELTWAWTIDKIKTATDDMIVKSKLIHDKVGGLKYDDVNYDTVVKVSSTKKKNNCVNLCKSFKKSID